MGWRIATTRRPFARRMAATRRVVWLLPAPVRTAHTDTTGTFAFSMLAFGPMSRKSAPQARTWDAWCITVSCETSLYAKTTWSTSRSRMSARRSDSGWIGMPSG